EPRTRGPGLLDERDELLPRRELSSDLSLRELDEEHGDGLGERVEVGNRHQLVRGSDERGLEAVELPVCVVLVKLEVTRRMKGDAARARAIAPDPERDLLCHCPARHEDGRFLAEQSGDVALERGDELATAVAV